MIVVGLITVIAGLSIAGVLAYFLWADDHILCGWGSIIMGVIIIFICGCLTMAGVGIWLMI